MAAAAEEDHMRPIFDHLWRSDQAFWLQWGIFMRDAPLESVVLPTGEYCWAVQMIAAGRPIGPWRKCPRDVSSTALYPTTGRSAGTCDSIHSEQQKRNLRNGKQLTAHEAQLDSANSAVDSALLMKTSWIAGK